MIEDSKKKFNLISVLMIVLMSNTMYFGLIFRKATIVVYIALAIISLLIYKKLKMQNLKIILIFVIIMSINSIINFNIIDKSYIMNEIQILIILTATMIIISNISIHNFAINYIKVMYILALISLVCYFIARFIPNLSEKLYFNATYGLRIYKVSPLYTWGWDNLFTRNAGAFWEPGAYQGFLNIAFLMTVIYKKYIINPNLKMIIFLITIITTQSTTGYIVFIIIAISFYKEISSSYSTYKIFNKLIIFIVIFISVFTIFKSGNIVNKFSVDNGSKIIRGNDLENSLKMSTSRILRGYGVGSFKNEQEMKYGIQNNSNGLLYLLYSQGIVIFLYYIYRLRSGIFSMFYNCNKFKKYTILSIFFILYFTEGLVWLPFYTVFIFNLKRNDYDEESLYL